MEDAFLNDVSKVEDELGLIKLASEYEDDSLEAGLEEYQYANSRSRADSETNTWSDNI